MKIPTRIAMPSAVALGAFALIGGTGLTVSSAWLITVASQYPPILVLSVAIVMVRFFGIFRSAARYGERVISHEAVFRKLTEIRVELFNAISTHLKKVDVSRNAKLIIDDVDRAQEFSLRVTLPGRAAAISGLFTLLVAAWIDFSIFAWILPAIVFFSLAVPFAVRKFLDVRGVQIEDRENDFAEQVADASLAFVEAEIFGYSEIYRSELRNSAGGTYKSEISFINRTSIIQCSVLLAIGSAIAGIAKTLAGGSELLPVQISMAIFLALVGFEGYTTWFPALYPSGKNRRAAHHVEELKSLTQEPQSLGIKPVGSSIIARDFSPFWKSKILTPLDFELSPGEVLVVTGESGVGKTTLASSLFGFADYEGSLTLGGVEVRNISEKNLLISGTLQTGHIFNTTLRENVRIANADLEDDEITRVLRLLELEGIDLGEVVGEFGRALSGGEAKRLSIARALLAKTPVIILDEPLEHLDFELSQRIQKEIMSEAEGKILIVITHAPWSQYSQKLVLKRE